MELTTTNPSSYDYVAGYRRAMAEAAPLTGECPVCHDTPMVFELVSGTTAECGGCGAVVKTTRIHQAAPETTESN